MWVSLALYMAQAVLLLLVLDACCSGLVLWARATYWLGLRLRALLVRHSVAVALFAWLWRTAPRVIRWRPARAPPASPKRRRKRRLPSDAVSSSSSTSTASTASLGLSSPR